MDMRGQVSIEFLLILGFIIVIVLVVASLAGPQIEKNSISSAVREGASNALYELSSTNTSFTPNRVTRINMSGSGNITYIKVQFSNPLPSNYQSFVLNQTMQSVLNQSGFTMINNTTVKSSNNIYTIII
ncbi:MAG: pilus assembly protein [Methanobacteriaceae archaeon]|nr:pilus assembly protein [Methanobacteriaceae archaeon]MDP3622465.1 pilus assembly protein [Methanobacteriaceae archaeon]